MTPVTAAILDDLAGRELIHDSTDAEALRARLDDGPITVYSGFDPTADSLHIGNLVPLLVLRRFQDAGHRPIALAGGATGMIGDPGGRSEERNLLDDATLDANLAAIRAPARAVRGPERRRAACWSTTGPGPHRSSVLEFLRDVGKHVTVNTMLAKESVKSRLESETGISYTEFSYMLLQANDYAVLHQDARMRAADRRVGPVGQHHRRHRPHPPPHRRSRARADRAPDHPGRRGQVRQVGRRRRVAEPRAHLALRLLPVLDQHRRPRRRALPAAADPAAGRRGGRGRRRPTPTRPNDATASAGWPGRSPTLVHGTDATGAAEAASAILFGGDPAEADAATLEMLAGEVGSFDHRPDRAGRRRGRRRTCLTSRRWPSRLGDARRGLAGGEFWLNGRRLSRR